jgi:hypothetical protein
MIGFEQFIAAWSKTPTPNGRHDEERDGKGGLMLTCPCHHDPNPSLHLTVADDGTLLLHCFGCPARFPDVIQTVGLSEQQRSNGAARPGPRDPDLLPDGQTGYRYDGERGGRWYRTVRIPQGPGKKKFVAYRWDRKQQKWLPGVEGATLPLYNLPRLVAADRGELVFWFEGEQDADCARRMGLLSTTTAFGAKGYKRGQAMPLTKRTVVVCPDNDAEGESYAAEVVEDLGNYAARVAVLRLPGLGPAEDFTDWVTRHGGTRETFLELAQAQLVPSKNAFVAFSSVANENLKPPSDLEPEALYGLPGEVVCALEPHTEAAPAGVLASLLVSFGCLLGRGPHVTADGARHGTNLFACLVGQTASGRKGTASNRADVILSLTDADYPAITHSGLSSGEGLIHHVRDARVEQIPVKQKGRYTGEYDEVVMDQGATEKRANIREEEFASVLKLMTREGNTLSNVIRYAWDNKKLGNLTKNSKEVATDAHISILSHTTEVDLRRYLSDQDANNGFANRFLWVHVYRSKLLPRGGGAFNTAPLTHALRAALDHGKEEREYDLSGDALWLWEKCYVPLGDHPPGLLGAVTSRAEPQVLRLALLYAVMDRAEEIKVPHLLAALAFWDYCFRSARAIFGEATGDSAADRIEELLWEHPDTGTSRTQIRNCFHRHVKTGDIVRGLNILKELGRAEYQVRNDTGGRPLELWFPLVNESGLGKITGALALAREVVRSRFSASA